MSTQVPQVVPRLRGTNTGVLHFVQDDESWGGAGESV